MLSRFVRGLILSAILSAFVAVYGYFDKPNPAKALAETQIIWSAGEERNAQANASQHFRKHGAEFGFRTEAEYIAAAHAFIEDPPHDTLQTVQRDGDVVFYNPRLNYFAVMDKKGAPRTFFRLDPKKHGYKTNMDYFEAQKAR